MSSKEIIPPKDLYLKNLIQGKQTNGLTRSIGDRNYNPYFYNPMNRSFYNEFLYPPKG
jgi:hypothetical protein